MVEGILIMKEKHLNKLQRKVFRMDLGNPIVTTLVGLVVFYIGLKMFSGGMKSMGNIDHLNWFIANPIYMFFGGIIMTLLQQSSSLSTTAIIALVASGAVPLPAAIACVLGANIGTTGTIWKNRITCIRRSTKRRYVTNCDCTFWCKPIHNLQLYYHSYIILHDS